MSEELSISSTQIEGSTLPRSGDNDYNYKLRLHKNKKSANPRQDESVHRMAMDLEA
jgi:hypothetical protein